MKDLIEKKTLALGDTERKMLKMLFWHRMAIAAHRKAVKAMDRLDAFDREEGNPRAIWTLLETREGLLKKAEGHARAHIYCLDKAEKIKMTL